MCGYSVVSIVPRLEDPHQSQGILVQCIVYTYQGGCGEKVLQFTVGVPMSRHPSLVGRARETVPAILVSRYPLGWRYVHSQ